jgi:hypothetical protein
MTNRPRPMTTLAARFDFMSDLSGANKTAARVRRPPSLTVACFRLALVMVAAYPCVALIVEQITKTPIWETAGIAAIVCWLSATFALIVFHYFRQSGNAIAGTLGATLVRVGIPVVIGIAATSGGGKLRDDGFFGLIVVFYLIGLTADTMLSLAMARNASKDGGGQSHNG